MEVRRAEPDHGCKLMDPVLGTGGADMSDDIVHKSATELAALALANRNARIAWVIMSRGERYRDPVAQAA